MKRDITRLAAVLMAAALLAAPAFAQSPQQLDPDATRYMAMGDSLAAGFKAQPVTQGYAFLLYQNGVFDRMPHTLFNDIAVVGATSGDVKDHQVPLALIPAARGGFQPQYITLSVTGNDLAAIYRYAITNPTPPALQLFTQQTLQAYGENLAAILTQLAVQLPGVKIFVSNQYSSPEVELLLPGASQVIADFQRDDGGGGRGGARRVPRRCLRGVPRPQRLAAGRAERRFAARGASHERRPPRDGRRLRRRDRGKQVSPASYIFVAFERAL